MARDCLVLPAARRGLQPGALATLGIGSLVSLAAGVPVEFIREIHPSISESADTDQNLTFQPTGKGLHRVSGFRPVREASPLANDATTLQVHVVGVLTSVPSRVTLTSKVSAQVRAPLGPR